jgi:tetratricopeptide (TPR) repeat protein
VLREARALAAISHPNVVEVYDVVADADHVGIVMQRLHGTNLREWLQIRRARAEVVRVFVAIAHGLAAAHACGVCHRDVKPANVIVTPTGVHGDPRPHLVDFGLAALARPGVPVGTPAYAAPELMRGQPSDATADQYSYCVALHEALTGVRPRDAMSVSRALPRRWRRALVRGLAEDPTQRHPSMHALVGELRPVGARGLVTAAILAGAAAWAFWPSARECPSDELARSGVWTESRWHAITTAFVASGEPEVADDAITRIEPVLRGHVARWASVRTELCDAAPEQAEAALTCLSRARGRLDALLHRFELADSTTVERAMRAVASLGAPDACLEETQPIVDVDTRVALDDARAAYDLGRFADAYDAAIAIASTARENADEAALAEARWIEGLALSELGRTDDAIAALSDAYWACERLGLDDVGVRAAASLIAIVGADHADFAGAEQWHRHASARLARGGIDPIAQGQLLVNWGTVLAAHGRPADALPEQLAAIDALASLGPDHPFLAAAHSAAASSLISLARNDEALVHQQAALEIQLRVLGPNHPSTALSEGNIGSALLGLGRLAEAEPHLLAAIAIQARQLGDDNPTVAVTRTSLGTLYSDEGRLPEAIATYERAFTVLRDAGSPLAIVAEHGLATALMRAGRYDDALPHQLHVVDHYTQTRGPKRVETLRARFNLAELTLLRGDVAQARALADAASADLDPEVRVQLGGHVDRILRSIAAAEAKQKEG